MRKQFLSFQTIQRMTKKNIIFLFLLLPFLNACEKQAIPPNPFDDTIATQDKVEFELTESEPHSLAGLYLSVFKPTCANVGCHDGTFEPDFRTLKSTYNTLLMQKPIKNDGNQYTYRVHPYQVENSVLIARIEGQVDPPMPIQIEPDSDWEGNKIKYIENIKRWILEGAPDIMGNPYQPKDPIFLEGFAAQYNGKTLARSNSYQSIVLPDSVNTLDLLFSLSRSGKFDENIDSLFLLFGDVDKEIGYNKIQPIHFLQSPIYSLGLYGETVPFHYKYSLDLNNIEPSDSLYFIKIVYEKPNENLLFIPANNALYNIKKYMSFRY